MNKPPSRSLHNLTELAPVPKKVLVLCPHPDDFDVAGVTLRHFFNNGSNIQVAVAPTYSGILDSFYKVSDHPLDNAQRIATRNSEQQQSLEFFGLKPSQYSFFPADCDLDANGEMTASEKNAQFIKEQIEQHRPDAIFIPHPKDNNPAHSAMHSCVIAAIDLLDFDTSIYQQVDPKTQEVEITAFTPLSEADIAWKTQLLLHHQTQNHRNLEQRGITIAQRILLSNKDIASAHGLPYSHVEAFEVVHSS